MKNIFLFMIVLSYSCFTSGQVIFEINQASNLMDVDNMGNIYLVNDTEILKYDANGILLYRYSNALIGSISSIDVTNPLRILLFYKESNVIVFLNQQLATITDAIQICDLSNIEAIVAAASSKSGFWLYDALTMTLLFFDNNRILQKQTENLAFHLNNEKPLFLSEQNQSLYLQTKSKTLVFDIYGNLINTLPFASKIKIKVTDNQAYVLASEGIVKYNLFSKKKVVYSLKDYPAFLNAYFFKNHLILQESKTVKIIKN